MSAADLAPILRAAAAQRRLLWPRQRDTETDAAPCLYAVDTDVLHLYFRPWERAITNGGRPGYAEVFPGSNREFSIALGRALSEHIFFSLSGPAPLVILPPLEEEVAEAYRAVSERATEDTARADRNLAQIDELLRQARAADDPEAALKVLEAQVQEIAHLLGDEQTARTELRRFTQLLNHQRIAGPEAILDHTLVPDPALLALLHPPAMLGARITQSAYREAWFDRLHAANPDKRGNRIERDARMLARLEWVNRHHVSDPERPAPRLLLITGDQTMLDAAAGYVPPGAAHSFAELYLRHPRAYLAEPGVLSPDTTDATDAGESADLADWLDTLLAGAIDPMEGRDYLQKLTELAAASEADLIGRVRRLAEDQPDLLDRFRADWRRYTRRLILDRPTSDQQLELVDGRRRQTIEDYQQLIEDLREPLDKKIQEAWDECLGLVAAGAYRMRSLGHDDGDIPTRSVPRLYFQRFPRTCAFVTQVLNSYQSGGLNAQSWQQALQDLKKDDPSYYAYFLALGVLFAGEGLWRISAILGQRALDIAEREAPALVSGREAAYLKAVALRHCARRAPQLGEVEALLQQAEDAYARDRADHTGLHIGPQRFTAERLALQLTYHLHHRLLPSGPAPPAPVPALADLGARIRDLIEALDQADAEPEEVLRHVRRQLLAKGLLTELLRVGFEGAEPDRNWLCQATSALREQLDQDAGDWRTPYHVEALLRTCEVLCAERGELRERRHQADACLAPDQTQRRRVMVYDGGRFAFFLHLVEHGLRPLQTHEQAAIHAKATTR